MPIKSRAFFTSFLILSGLLVLAQPRVPKVVEFADMKLEINDNVRSSIQKDVNALHASQTHLQQRLDLINLYFPIIEEIFKEEKVPDDIKYLVIQESGLIPDAVSTSNAVGFWQFKDFTAREVGLRVDNKIDERKNIVSASRGAATYLKRNNFQFDNWAYAISAYQAGLGGVKRYVDKKYYGAKKMPITKDTHWYLRKFIAHKIAFEGIIGGPNSTGLKLVQYDKGSGETLKEIAKKSKVEEELLRYYNKWIRNEAIPTDKTYVVIIPVQGKLPKSLFEETVEPAPKAEVAAIEKAEELKFPDEIKPGISDYRNAVAIRVNGVKAILSGTNDNLASLAAEAGISPEKMMKHNDLVNDQINNGALYYTERKKSSSDIGFHITKSGEQLWDISQKYAIRLDKLAKRNRIGINDRITTGQVIWLSSRRPKNTPFEYHDVTSNTLSIKEGKLDILAAEVPSDEKLEAVTRITSEEPVNETPELNESVESEEVVTKPSEEVKPVSFDEKTSTHRVQEGETLWSISKLYDITVEELSSLNNLTKYDVLRIGQLLAIEEPVSKKRRESRETVIYIVRGGDTLYQIAKKYNMSVTELMDLNKKETSTLSVGEELQVYRN